MKAVRDLRSYLRWFSKAGFGEYLLVASYEAFLAMIWRWSREQVLYDLLEDFGETRNVVHHHEAVARELEIEICLQIKRPELDLWVRRAVS